MVRALSGGCPFLPQEIDGGEMSFFVMVLATSCQQALTQLASFPSAKPTSIACHFSPDGTRLPGINLETQNSLTSPRSASSRASKLHAVLYQPEHARIEQRRNPGVLPPRLHDIDRRELK
jgi:hypothetical protein